MFQASFAGALAGFGRRVSKRQATSPTTCSLRKQAWPHLIEPAARLEAQTWL
jgi:hypothetical protein